jgi:hypothetical protein
MTYKLQPVPPSFIDRAWKEGAHNLAKACDTSGGEVTGDQLKMLLSRGDRSLLRIDLDGQAVGWVVIRIDQLPNVRVLHVCELYAPGGHWQPCWEQLTDLAKANGCSEIRCSAKPAQAKLYQRHQPWEPVYTTLRVSI